MGTATPDCASRRRQGRDDGSEVRRGEGRERAAYSRTVVPPCLVVVCIEGVLLMILSPSCYLTAEDAGDVERRVGLGGKMCGEEDGDQ